MQGFTEGGPKNGIASFYFNQLDRSMTIVGYDLEATMLLLDIEYNPDTDKIESFDSQYVDLTDSLGQIFSSVTGYKNLRAFSNPDYDAGKGIVRIYNWSGTTGDVIFEWVG